MVAVAAVLAQVDDVALLPGFPFVVRDVGEADVAPRVGHGRLAAQHHAPGAQLDHGPQRPAVAFLEHLGFAPGLAVVDAPRHVDGQPALGQRTTLRLVPPKDQLLRIHKGDDQRAVAGAQHRSLRTALILLRLGKQRSGRPALAVVLAHDHPTCVHRQHAPVAQLYEGPHDGRRQRPALWMEQNRLTAEFNRGPGRGRGGTNHCEQQVGRHGNPPQPSASNRTSLNIVRPVRKSKSLR